MANVNKTALGLGTQRSVIRELFDDYPGCIIAVSHDRLFASTVFTRQVELDAQGLHDSTNFVT